jgi:hypothetical protein
LRLARVLASEKIPYTPLLTHETELSSFLSAYLLSRTKNRVSVAFKKTFGTNVTIGKWLILKGFRVRRSAQWSELFKPATAPLGEFLGILRSFAEVGAVFSINIRGFGGKTPAEAGRACLRREERQCGCRR